MAAKFDQLLAKSQKKGDPFYHSMKLIGHLQDVYAAAERVFGATGADQLRAVGLDVERYLPRFRRCLLLAAAIHDLGKANDHFQGMIWGTRNIMVAPQGMRHEWVTIVMLHGLKPWLLPAVEGNETDFAIVEWAVAGHHPSPTHDSPPKASPNGAGVELETLLGHQDAAAILDWIASRFPAIDAGRRPSTTNLICQLGGEPCVFDDIGRKWRRARMEWEGRIKASDDRKFAAVVKDCLVAADIAGSAIPKAMPSKPDRWDWITAAFDSCPRPGNLLSIVKTRLGSDAARPFQLKVATSDRPVTFVKAGCGTGKTLSAYMWAAQNHPTRRLYFCYPTTGTATEGFKDYLFEPVGELGQLGAQLFHSRRDIDFEIILTNGTAAAEADEVAAKLESLESWSTPIVSCTVDTVLGVIQNNRRGLFGWPALSQSAFVFDEIHAYDDRLFGALLRFLAELSGLPALLMTASLTKPREEALRVALAKRGIDLSPIEGPAELERLNRYHRVVAPANDPLRLIAAEMRAGGKVLWVCNTVARVMEAADAAEQMGRHPSVYHSRFKYVDRVERHKEVVEAFTPERPGPALAICSQVAEMSLDLKGCTLLVTDLAPVPALIQRLGRLNRQAKPGDPTRPFCVIEVEKPAPYEAEHLEAARSWLSKLPNGPVSQRDLADRWEQTATEATQVVESAWLDGGPVTTVRELRELSPGVTVLLRTDVDQMQASKGRDKDVGRYVIPMNQPPGVKWQTWDRFQGIPIAESSFIAYDRKRGAQWQNSSSQPLIV